MSAAIRNHLRHNVYGMVAIFIALSGTAYAVDGTNPGVNTIGSEDIIGGEVKSSDIGNGLVSSADLKNETLTDADLGTDSVQADEIRFWSIGSDELALSAVGDAHIKDNAIRPDEIQADAVGQSEIAPDAVGGPELAVNAVGSRELKGPLYQVSQSAFASPGQSAQALATCPDNHQLLGGGGGQAVLAAPVDSIPRQVLLDSPIGNSWAYAVRNTASGGSSLEIKATAVCLVP